MFSSLLKMCERGSHVKISADLGLCDFGSTPHGFKNQWRPFVIKWVRIENKVSCVSFNTASSHLTKSKNYGRSRQWKDRRRKEGGRNTHAGIDICWGGTVWVGKQRDKREKNTVDSASWEPPLWHVFAAHLIFSWWVKHAHAHLPVFVYCVRKILLIGECASSAVEREPQKFFY